MNIYSILTHALIALTGMIMATFAAYYLLSEWGYSQSQVEFEDSVE